LKSVQQQPATHLPDGFVRTELYEITFSGAMLVRGFWLYVWEIVAEDGKTFLYVGMTGDSSSPNAQSPFGRLSQHLGSNKHSNALRRRLGEEKIKPESCQSFSLVANGPILPEVGNMNEHRPLRATVAALEKALADALKEAGYAVLNMVNCREEPNLQLWAKVRNAFAQRFPRLTPQAPQGDT
jgi:hypothetical protein